MVLFACAWPGKWPYIYIGRLCAPLEFLGDAPDRADACRRESVGVGTSYPAHELLRRAPVQALALAQRALAQTPAAACDPREQGLARPFAALALERGSPGRREQAGEHDQVVLLAEQFGEPVGAAGELPLAEDLGIPKLNFQVMRRTMATQAQKMGSVKDIQAHLRHSRPDTTANEYMQELPESVREMVGSVYLVLVKGGEEKHNSDDCNKMQQIFQNHPG